MTPRSRASAGSKTNAKDETAAAEVEAEVVKPQKRRLPAKDFRWILAQETRETPATYQALKLSSPELVPRPGEKGDEELAGLYVLARAFYVRAERFSKLQDWVHGELRDKGYIEVDDEWFQRMADAQAVIDREWPKIRAMMEQLYFSEGGGGEFLCTGE